MSSIEGKGRPVQPKCSHCGKALYKRMDPGGVKTTDPYGWCRNASCEAYNTDQSGESRFAPVGGTAPVKPASAKTEPKPAAKVEPKATGKAPKVVPPKPTKAPAPDKAKTKARAATDAAEAAEVAEAAAAAVGAKSAEPSGSKEGAVAKARERIGLALAAVEKTYSKAVIGLTLAIVSQEMGSHEAANALIAEYGLTEQYGIEPKA